MRLATIPTAAPTRIVCYPFGHSKSPSVLRAPRIGRQADAPLMCTRRPDTLALVGGLAITRPRENASDHRPVDRMNQAVDVIERIFDKGTIDRPAIAWISWVHVRLVCDLISPINYRR